MADWRPNLISAPCYRDPRAAMAWLEKAFGFEVFMLLEDADGNVAHCEMRYGGSVVMVASEWNDDYRAPASLEGKNTSRFTSILRAGLTCIASGPAPPERRSSLSQRPSSTAIAPTDAVTRKAISGPWARLSPRSQERRPRRRPG